MKNKKGFILVETVIVMSIVMISLLGIYRTYSVLLKKSIQSSYYDNINDVYRLNVILKIVGANFLNQTTFYKINQTECTITGCTNIIDNIIIRDSTTNVDIISIPNGYNLENIPNTYTNRNSLIRYLETAYNNKKLIVIRYMLDAKERYASLEV